MKKFEFIPNPDVNPKHAKPTAIKKLVPDWYKKGELYWKQDGQEIPGLKACLPFLDVMIIGYALTTPVDVYVSEEENGSISLKWDTSLHPQEVVRERKGEIGQTIPRPAGHRENHLIWNSSWGWKVPKGYSVLVTHPLNRSELPFTTLSALVDSDKYVSWGNIPFFIKEDFVGVIPAGTPYAQLIPIKRGKWVYVENWLLTKTALAQGALMRSGKQMYKKLFRAVKEL
jgi:hypothetical protein